MTINKSLDENTATLKIVGWLNTQTAPELETALGEMERNVTALVLDFGALEYISSAGVRQIVAAYKKMNGALTLRHVSPEIMNILRMTGLDKRLHIEP